MASYSLGGDTAGLPVDDFYSIPYEIDTFTVMDNWVPGGCATTALVTVEGDPWQSKQDFVLGMVGGVLGVTGPTGDKYFNRVIPTKNPMRPYQFCTRLEQVKSWGQPDTSDNQADPVSGWPIVNRVQYRGTWEGLPYQIVSDEVASGKFPTHPELMRYVIRKRRAIPREISYAGGSFAIKGTTPPVTLGQTLFKVVAYGDLEYTWVRVPVENIPYTTINSMLGKINSAEFDPEPSSSPPFSGGYSIGIGKVLFSGYNDYNRYFDAVGDWVCDLVYSFRVHPENWNYALNAQGQWVEIEVPAVVSPPTSAVPPYSSANLNDLFNPEE